MNVRLFNVHLNLALRSGIASLATPFLVALINQPTWKPIARVLIAVLVSLGVAAATVAIEGRLNGVRWTTAVLLILGGVVFLVSDRVEERRPAARGGELTRRPPPIRRRGWE